MASIVAKLARAAVASRASLAAVAGRRPIHPCLPRLSLTGDAIRRMCSRAGKRYQMEKGGPKSEENCCPKSEENRCHRSLDPYLTVVDGKVLESKEAMYSLYEYWCKYYGISRDPAEMRRRFVTFKSSARFVHKTNKGRTGPLLALNGLADMTMEETYPRPYYRAR